MGLEDSGRMPTLQTISKGNFRASHEVAIANLVWVIYMTLIDWKAVKVIAEPILESVMRVFFEFPLSHACVTLKNC